jgi:hypothetical protein
MNTHNDEYGFYCDLESQEEDDVEYYVVTTRTHYEVRRKSKNATKINGEQRTNIISLESAKSSTSELTKMQNNCAKEDKKQPFYMCLPKDIFYSLCVCFATCSCIYFVMTTE